MDSVTAVWHAVLDFLSFDRSQAIQADMLVRYAIQILLLCGSAFFSGSETALFSLSHVDLQQLRRKGHRHSQTLQAMLDEPRRLIVSILCGNELVNVAAVANMTGILVALYGDAKAGWIAIIVMLPMLLLFGEVTPKTIAVSNPQRFSAGIVARPLSYWVRLIAPVRWVVRSISDRITTIIVGPQRDSEHLLQIDEFRSVLEDVEQAGTLDATSRLLINNLLSAGATEIVQILMPRSRVVFLDGDVSLPELIEKFRAARHSRVPVYRKHRDNLIGFLHAEDVLRITLDRTDLTTLQLEDLVHPPVVVPLTKTIAEMFDFFAKNKVRAAAALNEFGGVAGFITMNDVLRFVFGPLVRSVDTVTRIKTIGPNSYEMPGDTKLGEVNRVTNFGIRDPRMTTIGGVAFRQIDQLPSVGDEVRVDDITITVLKMDEHRIAQVRASRGNVAPEDIATATGETFVSDARRNEGPSNGETVTTAGNEDAKP